MIAGCALLLGCDGRQSLTVSETKQRYATSIVAGAAVGASWTVTADRYDADEGLLIAVRMDDNFGKYVYAERARIIVDPVANTVALRLENVTAAYAEDEKAANASGIYTTASLVTEPVRVPYDILP